MGAKLSAAMLDWYWCFQWRHRAARQAPLEKVPMQVPLSATVTWSAYSVRGRNTRPLW